MDRVKGVLHQRIFYWGQLAIRRHYNVKGSLRDNLRRRNNVGCPIPVRSPKILSGELPACGVYHVSFSNLDGVLLQYLLDILSNCKCLQHLSKRQYKLRREPRRVYAKSGRARFHECSIPSLFEGVCPHCCHQANLRYQWLPFSLARRHPGN